MMLARGPSLLPCSYVHDRHSEKRTFPQAARGVSDETSGMMQECRIRVERQAAHAADRRRRWVLLKRCRGPERLGASGVEIRQDPDDRQVQLLHDPRDLGVVLRCLRNLCDDRMVRHHQVIRPQIHHGPASPLTDNSLDALHVFQVDIGE
jgi:hypothetical protein